MSNQRNPIKRLAGETLIYGLGTTIPRLLNYLLTPLLTTIFIRSDFAVITDLYSWIAILLVILTYGMETSFFRYASENENKKKVFGTAFLSILFTALIFALLLYLFLPQFSSLLKYKSHPEFILYVGIIVIFDALSAIPFASLRLENKPLRFSAIKIIGVIINIGVILFFLVLCPYLQRNYPHSIFLSIYNPSIKVRYVFIANIISSFITFLLLTPQIGKVGLSFDKNLWKKLINYALPIALIILAGMVNEVSDKIMMKYLLPQETMKERMTLVGEYGANFKLAILMSIFIQMFRYAAEPFFFQHARENNSKLIYADVMKYFIVFAWIIFLGVMLYIDIWKYFINGRYHNALGIVPIILMAKFFQGITYNLSIWYKLTNKTMKGAYIAFIGTGITLGMNFIFVPVWGYYGAAYGQLACYGVMMILSYIVGRKYFKVNYPLKRIGLYSLIAVLVFYISEWVHIDSLYIRLSFHTILLILFIAIIYLLELGFRKKERKLV